MRRNIKLETKYSTGALIRLEFNKLFKNVDSRKYKATS
jgi:hypothetical protein